MKEREYIIEIKFKAGSEFQEEIFDTHLGVFMNALREGTLRGHKGNKIEIKAKGGRILFNEKDGFYRL